MPTSCTHGFPADRRIKSALRALAFWPRQPVYLSWVRSSQRLVVPRAASSSLWPGASTHTGGGTSKPWPEGRVADLACARVPFAHSARLPWPRARPGAQVRPGQQQTSESLLVAGPRPLPVAVWHRGWQCGFRVTLSYGCQWYEKRRRLPWHCQWQPEVTAAAALGPGVTTKLVPLRLVLQWHMQYTSRG